jgi:hypothetical protein
MACIPHAIGTIGLDYTLNAKQQIEGRRRSAPAGERLRSVYAAQSRK